VDGLLRFGTSAAALSQTISNPALITSPLCP
jgi:hypothetical protein